MVSTLRPSPTSSSTAPATSPNPPTQDAATSLSREIPPSNATSAVAFGHRVSSTVAALHILTSDSEEENNDTAAHAQPVELPSAEQAGVAAALSPPAATARRSARQASVQQEAPEDGSSELGATRGGRGRGAHGRAGARVRGRGRIKS